MYFTRGTEELFSLSPFHLPPSTLKSPAVYSPVTYPAIPPPSALLCWLLQLSGTQAVASSRLSSFVSGRFKTQCFARDNITIESCFDILSEIKPTEASL